MKFSTLASVMAMFFAASAVHADSVGSTSGDPSSGLTSALTRLMDRDRSALSKVSGEHIVKIAWKDSLVLLINYLGGFVQVSGARVIAQACPMV